MTTIRKNVTWPEAEAHKTFSRRLLRQAEQAIDLLSQAAKLAPALSIRPYIDEDDEAAHGVFCPACGEQVTDLAELDTLGVRRNEADVECEDALMASVDVDQGDPNVDTVGWMHGCGALVRVPEEWGVTY